MTYYVIAAVLGGVMAGVTIWAVWYDHGPTTQADYDDLEQDGVDLPDADIDVLAAAVLGAKFTDHTTPRLAPVIPIWRAM